MRQKVHFLSFTDEEPEKVFLRNGQGGTQLVKAPGLRQEMIILPGGVRTQIPGLRVRIQSSSPRLGANMLCDLELVT